MATCQIPGHPDSYGLGIRITFYLQWFGMIIAAWTLPSDAINFRFLNSLTTAATAIGLAINIGDLQPAEILVVLLLVCGALYFFVPIYLWRACTLCRQWWDPTPWTREGLGSLFKTSLFLMYGALLCLQLWFWSTGVHYRPSTTSSESSSGEEESSPTCKQYGFLFAPVRLDDAVLITFNIALHLIMLVVGTWVFACWIGLLDECRWYRKRKKERWRTTPRRIRALQEFRTISDVIVASVVTTAIELIISWNDISGVNNLDTAAQLVPLAISAAYLLRSFYLWVSAPSSEPDPYTTGTNTVASSRRGRSQSRREHRVLYSRPGRNDWTRRHRRQSHRSSRQYDGYNSPQMAAVPSTPHATYTQQFGPAVEADIPIYR